MATRVTQEDRKKTGMRGKNKGKYPVRTHQQRMSAIRLRHNGKGVSASAVLGHVARAARAAGDKAALAAVARAREVDANQGKRKRRK